MNKISSAEAVPAALRGITVIDADTHVSEWDDLWTSRAPAKYKDRVPKKKKVDGRYLWMIDGDKSIGLGSPVSAIAKDGSKCSNLDFLNWDLKDAHVGAYDVKERVKFMDEIGVHAQIAYPNVLGFGGQNSAVVDPELRLVSSQIYNDAMAEMQADSGNRIFPMALLPWWDVKAAVTEAKRCHKMGMRGININSDPQTHGLPNLSEAHWNPLWETCVENDLPVNFHIGSSETSLNAGLAGGWAEVGSRANHAFVSTQLFVGNSRTLANIILSLFLERFPTLKIVSVESGIGWLPFLLEALHYEMNECEIKYKVPPAEIFRRQIYGCTWFERESLVENTRKLGVDNVLFETDYPHPTCLYPDALNFVADVAAKFTPEERKKVFGGNAARVYNIPI